MFLWKIFLKKNFFNQRNMDNGEKKKLVNFEMVEELVIDLKILNKFIYIIKF